MAILHPLHHYTYIFENWSPVCSVRFLRSTGWRTGRWGCWPSREFGTLGPTISRLFVNYTHFLASEHAKQISPETIWWNICCVNITKLIIFQLSIHLTSFVVALLVKFGYFTSTFVPNLDAKSAVPVLNTRDGENLWCFLFTKFLSGLRHEKVAGRLRRCHTAYTPVTLHTMKTHFATSYHNWVETKPCAILFNQLWLIPPLLSLQSGKLHLSSSCK